MKNKQTITLSDGKEVEISLLPLRAYGELLTVLTEVFKEVVTNWENASNDDIIGMLPEFIRDHVDEVGGIIEVGTRGQVTAKEAVDERGLADGVTIMTAVIECNDIQGVVNSVKKAMAAFQKHKAQAKSPTAAPNESK